MRLKKIWKLTVSRRKAGSVDHWVWHSITCTMLTKKYFVTDENWGQMDEVGISNNKYNSINSQVTNYTTGVHSTGDWSDWYNVPFNLTISCVCIPGCNKSPITRRKLSEHVNRRISRNITKNDLRIQCKACIHLLNSVGYGNCIYCNRIKPINTKCCDSAVRKLPKKVKS